MYLNGLTLKQIAKQITGNENDRKKISELLKLNNIPVRYKGKLYNFNENYFEVIDTEEKAYWLGFIYADGYITRTKPYNSGRLGLALGINDKEHLERFKCSIEATHPIRTYLAGGFSNNEYCRMIITSNKLVKDLIKLGVYENKTTILKFPSASVLPDNLKNHFMN